MIDGAQAAALPHDRRHPPIEIHVGRDGLQRHFWVPRAERTAHDGTRSLHPRDLEIYRLMNERNQDMVHRFDAPKRAR